MDPFTGTIAGIALWKWLLGLAGMGYMGWGQYQKGQQMGGQLGLQQETLAFQREQVKAGTEAQKRAYKEQRGMTKEQMAMMTKLRREERGEARTERFETGQQMSADRQLALVLSMIQAMSQENRDLGSMTRGIPSIPSLLR